MIASRDLVTLVTCSLLGFSAMTTGHASPPDTDHALRGNPLWAVPLRTLVATRERPIFSPSRRPPLSPAVAVAPAPAPPASAKAPEPDRPPLSILGTVVGRSDALGVFMEDVNRNVLRLHVGQDYAGWVLRAVNQRQVNFEKGSFIATLSLPAPGEEKAAAPTAGTPPGEPQAIGPAPAAIAQIAASPVAGLGRRRRD